MLGRQQPVSVATQTTASSLAGSEAPNRRSIRIAAYNQKYSTGTYQGTYRTGTVLKCVTQDVEVQNGIQISSKNKQIVPNSSVSSKRIIIFHNELVAMHVIRMIRTRPVSIALLLLLASTTLEAWVCLPQRISIIQRMRGAGTTPPLRSSRAAYNVVLAPSEQADAFDNFKVGNCRVHRYSRDIDAEETTEYVMWYHGRNTALASNKNLPPLSTGRIGRAISRNGLVWEKDVTGSISEDVKGVTLGLNQESWWSFDTTHVGLGSVLLPLSTPAVMTEGGVYLMYYMGGSGEETAMADYIDTDTTLLPDSMKDAVLQGMKMKIGVALSQDGISWGRVEGDDPSGACMVPFDKSDPNQQYQNTDVREELYCAWPEVAVHSTASEKSESFFMYYSTMMANGKKEKCIAYAVSEDGFRWFKRGVCVAPSNDVNSLDAQGCARCCVVKDAAFDSRSQRWIESENGWKMYYEGGSPVDNKHRILWAESKNGKDWSKRGLALDVGADGAWDCKGVGSPHCIR